eukprot:m.100641 g.100641  ORF g.100641 m.100641 type:complete len:136 (-) comp13179_c0_seq2:200-607(-)
MQVQPSMTHTHSTYYRDKHTSQFILTTSLVVALGDAWMQLGKQDFRLTDAVSATLDVGHARAILTAHTETMPNAFRLGPCTGQQCPCTLSSFAVYVYCSFLDALKVLEVLQRLGTNHLVFTCPTTKQHLVTHRGT